jgi:hypothetical protein
MTDSLRDALRDAADHGTPGVPGTTGRELLDRGRRKARRRRVSGTAFGGVALVAAVGLPLAPNLVSGPDDQAAPDPDGRNATPAGPRDSARDGSCEAVDSFDGWTVRAAVHRDGKSTVVLTSPDGSTWGECLGEAGNLTTMKPDRPNVEPDPGYTWIRHNFWWDDGCATAAGGPCAWGLAGQLPVEVDRMTLESADGRTTEADVNEGFFAWHSEVDGIDVFNQPLWVTLYDANGDQIDRLNANRDPDTW